MEKADYVVEETIGILPLTTKLLKEYYKVKDEKSPLYDYSNRKIFAELLKLFDNNSKWYQTFDNGTPQTEDDYEGFYKDTIIRIPKAKKDLAELIGMEVGNTKDEEIKPEIKKILINPLWSKGEEDKQPNDYLIKVALGEEILEKGNNGEHTGKIQDALIEFNIMKKEDLGENRGSYGDKTAGWVKKFQQEYMSIKDSSGKIGSNTILAMDKALNVNWKYGGDINYKVKDKTKYFVLHTADYMGNTSSSWIKGEKKSGNVWIGHGFILNNGEIIWMINKSLEEERYASKQEGEKKTSTSLSDIKGSMIHFEQVYAAKDGPSQRQYEVLAEIYSKIYNANNKKKLIIVPHKEVDRGITKYHSKGNRAHDDPWNYDFDKLFSILKNSYGIDILQGVDSITVERYKAKNEDKNKIHWPPVLKGKVEND